MIRKEKNLLKEYEKTIKDIHKQMDYYVEMAEEGYSIIEGMLRFLPEGWAYAYTHYGNLEFAKEKGENNDPLEFREVCRHVERITNVKLDRKVSAYSPNTLRADGWKGSLTINVRLGHPKCKIEWEEIEIHEKKKVAKVPDECLGIVRRKEATT